MSRSQHTWNTQVEHGGKTESVGEVLVQAEGAGCRDRMGWNGMINEAKRVRKAGARCRHWVLQGGMAKLSVSKTR